MPKAISLHRQLLIWLTIILSVLFLLSGVISYYRTSYFAHLAYDRTLLRIALSIADQIEYSSIKQEVMIDLPDVARNLIEFDKEDDIYYRVTAPNGQLVVGEPVFPKSTRRPSSGEHLYSNAKIDDEPVRVVAFALPIENPAVKGTILVEVAETITKRTTMVNDIVESLIVPQLLMIILAIGLVSYGVKRGLLPLLKLKEAVAKRSPQDLSPISNEGVPQETLPLLNATNDLMGRVQQSITQQKHFIADAAHQLRTPIAGLKTQTELALREPDATQRLIALDHIHTSTARLSHLVNQLLVLARVEPGSQQDAAMQRVDIIALVKKTTRHLVPNALQHDVDLGFESDLTAIFVRGNTLMLGEMVSNLIDNAINYTPQGGEVTVSVQQANQYVKILVSDNGIGIAESDREIIFQRFHRVNENSGNGCGLGLAIVQEIAKIHDANIAVTAGADGKGSCFIVTLPIANDVA